MRTPFNIVNKLFAIAALMLMHQIAAAAPSPISSAARVEFLNSQDTPNYIVFYTVIYGIVGDANSDQGRSVRLVKAAFDESSDEVAAELLRNIRESIDTLEADAETSTRRLVCDLGGPQPDSLYYRRLDALDDALIANINRHYILFLASLSETHAEAFNAYLTSKRTTVQFRALDHKHSYETSGVDILSVIADTCANFGEPQ